MSCQPSMVLKPTRTNFKFRYERGTRLRVFTQFDGIVEGIAAAHSEDFDPKVLILEYAVFITGSVKDRNEVRTAARSFVRIYCDQVQSVEILDGVRKTRKVEKEKLHHTLIVSEHKQLDRLMSELKDVKKVGLNFYGIFVGRHGQISWITLFFSETLVCVDVLELASRRSDFWEKLGEELFSNEKIQKVIFNSRPIQDYLFHVHCIMLKNVFDIQVSELYIWMQGKSKKKLEASRNQVRYNRLSAILEIFLKKKESIPEAEVDLLKTFEIEDFTHESPLMTRPITDEKKYCKCVAIEMKYLLILKSELHNIMLNSYYAGVSAQLEEMLNLSNGRAETQLKVPDSVPAKVYKSLSKSIVKSEDKNVPPYNGKSDQYRKIYIFPIVLTLERVYGKITKARGIKNICFI